MNNGTIKVIRNAAYIVIGAVIGVTAAFVAGALSAQPSAEGIYRAAAVAVVELKCVADNSGESFGSAVLVSADGEFITNAHVVTYASGGQTRAFDEYWVRFAFESDYREATLVEYEVARDLALVRLSRLPDFGLTAVKFGNSAGLKSGETVYAVGNAMNYGITMTRGIVGVPLLNIEYDGGARGVIQCDLTIAEGNSGGALLDARGRLIGVTAFRTKDSLGRVVYGIAYSIPTAEVRDFIGY